MPHLAVSTLGEDGLQIMTILVKILAELVDNFLALRKSNVSLPDEITVRLNYDSHLYPDSVMITVSDQAGGMLNPIAMDCGEPRKSSRALSMNMVMVSNLPTKISAANPENDCWNFWTRTDNDIENDSFYYYEAPYDWETTPILVQRKSWRCRRLAR